MRIERYKNSIYIIVSFFCIFLISCSNVASVLNLDADLELNVEARADMNPDDRDIASPLVIRLYELKDKAKFEKMSFYDLYQNDSKLLGKNIVDKHTFDPFTPDSKISKKLVLDKNTLYIGLFAEFTQYKNSEFLSVIKIDQHFDKTVNIVLTGNVLKIENLKKKHSDTDSHDDIDDNQKKMGQVSSQIPG